MNVLEARIESEPVDGGKWRLYALGDLHIDSKLTDIERIKKFVRLIAADPHAYWIFVGDAVDGTTPSHHFFEPDLVVPDIMANMSQYVAATLVMLDRILEPLKRKPGLVIQGNHDLRKGGTLWSGISWELARRLDDGSGLVAFGGDEALVRLKVSTPNKTRGDCIWVIHAAHGAGGGMYPGAKVNRFVNTVGHRTNADILVRGHVHDSDTRIVPVFDVTRKGPKPRLVKKHRAYMTAPSFMACAVEGVTSYASRKGYPPNDEGLIYLAVDNPTANGKAENYGRIYRMEAPF